MRALGYALDHAAIATGKLPHVTYLLTADGHDAARGAAAASGAGEPPPTLEPGSDPAKPPQVLASQALEPGLSLDEHALSLMLRRTWTGTPLDAGAPPSSRQVDAEMAFRSRELIRGELSRARKRAREPEA